MREFRATKHRGNGSTPAERQYQRFAQLPPLHTLVGSVRYPEKVQVAGYASAIGYRSDKFNGQWTDYIHQFGPLHPEVWAWSKGKYGIPYPKTWKPKSYAMLGFMLDLQLYQSPTEQAYLDYKHPRKGALLCGDGHSNNLYIIPVDPRDGAIMVLKSPILRIEPAGIVN